MKREVSSETKLVIFGSTDLTIRALEVFEAMGRSISLVVTLSEEFSISYSQASDNRVKNSRFVDVERYCRERKIVCLNYENNKQLLAALDNLKHSLGNSLCLVIGWYHLIPSSIRDLFEYGCFGVHASLLPQLKGGAPLNWAILNGLEQTGVSLFELSDGVDDGLIWLQEKVDIHKDETIATLIDKSRHAMALILESANDQIGRGIIELTSQAGPVSFGLQRIPDDGNINWEQKAEKIDRLVRAVSRPYSGACTYLDGQRLYVWRASVPDTPIQVFGCPGQIFCLGNGQIFVVTGDGLVELLEVSWSNGSDAMNRLRKSNHKRFETKQVNGN